jgi:hypothetical protein
MRAAGHFLPAAKIASGLDFTYKNRVLKMR